MSDDFRDIPPPVQEPGFGIYIHWPFCTSKCPYCDFNSHVAARVEAAQWRQAYLLALDRFAARTPGWRVTSVFFGGGTPSLMPPALVEALLAHIARRWPLADDVEITLEANPTSAEADNFAAFATAGVNRLSLGVQALDDTALRQLGRTHTVAEALRAWELARRHFPRASFDLIYARPGQTPRQWEGELRRALELAPAHMSAYQLTMEPETPFQRLHERGKLRLPEESTSLRLYRLTEDMLSAAGLAAYEVSNHAVPGEECRHNLLYWRYGPYVGIGPGAHGRLIDEERRRLALTAVRHPQEWLRAVLEGDDAGLAETEVLSARAVAAEYLLMSLRTREGTDTRRLQALSGLAPAAETLRRLRQRGLLRQDDTTRLATTRKGRLVLDAVVMELFEALCPAPAARRASCGAG